MQSADPKNLLEEKSRRMKLKKQGSPMQFKSLRPLGVVIGISCLSSAVSGMDLIWSPQGAQIQTANIALYSHSELNPENLGGSDILIAAEAAVKNELPGSSVRVTKAVDVIEQAIRAAYARGFRTVDISPNQWARFWYAGVNRLNKGLQSADKIQVRLSINIPAYLFRNEIDARNLKRYTLWRSEVQWLMDNVNYSKLIQDPKLGLGKIGDIRSGVASAKMIANQTEYMDMPASGKIISPEANGALLDYDSGRSANERTRYRDVFPSAYRNGTDAIGARECYNLQGTPNIGNDDVLLHLIGMVGEAMNEARQFLDSSGTVVNSVVYRNNSESAESNIGPTPNGLTCSIERAYKNYRTSFTSDAFPKASLDQAGGMDYQKWRGFYDARQAVYKRFLQWMALVIKAQKIKYPNSYSENVRFGFYQPLEMSAWAYGFYDFYELTKNSGMDLLITSSNNVHIPANWAQEMRVAALGSIASQLSIPWNNELTHPNADMANSGWERFISYAPMWNLPTVQKSWDGASLTLTPPVMFWNSGFFSTDAGKRGAVGTWHQFQGAAVYRASSMLYANWPVDAFVSSIPSPDWEKVIGPATPNANFKVGIDALPAKPYGKIAVYFPKRGRIVCENTNPHIAPGQANQRHDMLGGCNESLYLTYLYQRLQTMSGSGEKVEFFTDESIKDFTGRLSGFAKIVIPMEMAKSFGDLDSDIQVALQSHKSKLYFLKVTPPMPILAN